MEAVTYNIIEVGEHFGFELLRGDVAFQRQEQGSNSEKWTKAEAIEAAESALAYWATA